MASWCTTIAVMTLFIVTLHYAGFIETPSYQLIVDLLGGFQ